MPSNKGRGACTKSRVPNAARRALTSILAPAGYRLTGGIIFYRNASSDDGMQIQHDVGRTPLRRPKPAKVTHCHAMEHALERLSMTRCSHSMPCLSHRLADQNSQAAAGVTKRRCGGNAFEVAALQVSGTSPEIAFGKLVQ